MISSTYLFISILSIAFTASAGSVKRAVTNLPANVKWDYQIGGAYAPDTSVGVVTRDRSSTPVTEKYNICYINAFQTQPDNAAHAFWLNSEPSTASLGSSSVLITHCSTDSTRNALILRNSSNLPYEDKDWKGEYYFNTTTADNRKALAEIVNGWIDECKSKGFNAIEPDNLENFARSSRLITIDNNLDYAKLLAVHAHDLNLAIGQKNGGSELGSQGKDKAGFDFAIAEECQKFNECNAYTNVYGNETLEVEYVDPDADDQGRSIFDAACKARGSKISVIFRDVLVVPPGSDEEEYVYEEC